MSDDIAQTEYFNGYGGLTNLKILFVVNAHEFTAVHRLLIMRGAKRRGYVVEAVVHKGSAAFGRLRLKGFVVRGVNLSRRGVRVWEEISAIRGLARPYKRLAPAIVYHATIKSILIGSTGVVRERT